MTSVAAAAAAAAAAPQVFSLDDGQGTTLAVSDLGATWLSCRVPCPAPGNGDTATREVLLGRPTPAEHVSQGGYVGAVVGRYANRLAGARFSVDGKECRVLPNEGPNQLHGGPDGFDRRLWRCTEQGRRHLVLALHSPDGDQGYPGALDAQVRYAIAAPGCITLDFEARVDRACPVNLTSHAYFNLDGDAEPAHTIAAHRIAIAAAHWLPVDEALIPLGPIASVADSEMGEMDLRSPRAIGRQRFDHCYVLDGGPEPAARVASGDGRLQMTLHTDAPGLQFYGGHFLAGSTDRQGRPYAAGAGFALEPQHWPDGPNHPEWPHEGALLRPGAVFRRHIRLQFDASR